MSAIDIESFENTNFVFDIEANRRRRAELAHDVSELISISKFFQQHYAEDNKFAPIAEKEKGKIVSKTEKNRSNASRVRERGNKSGRNCQASKLTVANATEVHSKHKQTPSDSDTCLLQSDIENNLPPLFDKMKLHEYCVDVVDRFFHGTVPAASVSKSSLQSKTSSEKIKSSARSESGAVKMTKNPKYASVSARYMRVTPKVINDNPKRSKTALGTLVSTNSRKILEKIALKGVEIKKHSCLSIPRETKIEKTKSRSIQTLLSFREIDANIGATTPKHSIPRGNSNESMPEPIDSAKTVESYESAKEIEFKVDVNEAENRKNVSNETEITPHDNQQVDVSAKKLEEKSNEKASLQLMELPQLSIRPEIQCEIKKVFAIEIKSDPKQVAGNDIGDRNKVVECTYAPFAEEIRQRNIISLQLKGTETLKFNNRTARLNESSTLSATSDSDGGRKEKHANKYFEPFSNRRPSFVAEQPVDSSVVTSDDTLTPSHTENASSSNQLTISHLTDDEKYNSDRKYTKQSNRGQLRRSVPTSAKSVIDKILEVEGLSQEPSTAENGDKSSETSSHNFDDLREILQRIRNDKTSLDLAMEMEKFSKRQAELLAQQNAHSTETLDQETQCDTLFASTGKQQRVVIADADNQSTTRKSNRRQKKLLNVEPMLLKSPKFKRTIDSIRSSARHLERESARLEHFRATKDQVHRAAEKLLKSLLKERPNSNKKTDDESEDCSNSTSLNFNLQPKKYHIVNDQIVRSSFSNVIDRNLHEGETSSSDVPPLNLNLLSTRSENAFSPSKKRTAFSSDSDENTSTSMGGHNIHKFVYNNQNIDEGDLSDGEILSEGEIRAAADSF